MFDDAGVTEGNDGKMRNLGLSAQLGDAVSGLQDPKEDKHPGPTGEMVPTDKQLAEENLKYLFRNRGAKPAEQMFDAAVDAAKANGGLPKAK